MRFFMALSLLMTIAIARPAASSSISNKPVVCNLTLNVQSALPESETTTLLVSHAESSNTDSDKKSLESEKSSSKPGNKTSESEIKSIESEKSSSETEKSSSETDKERRGIRSFSGNASWYGIPFHGHLTASGEIFNMNKLSAAHLTLPLLSKALVEDPRTGNAVIVKVNDRGPYVKTRVMDLSREAARELGTLPRGVAYVDITVLELPHRSRKTQ